MKSLLPFASILSLKFNLMKFSYTHLKNIKMVPHELNENKKKLHEDFFVWN